MFLVPKLASASIFSAPPEGAPSQSDVDASLNSQTMPLLSPAVNLDPNPAVGGGDITLVDGTALLAQQGPSGTAADIENQPTNSQISRYTVRDGDTLSSIAQLFGVTTDTIIWANNIKGNVIQVGESLVILPITGIQHTVVSGETLATLAQKYNSDASDIAQYNDLADDASLTAGQVIIIPDGELSNSEIANQTGPSPKSGKKGSHESKIESIAKGTTTEPYLGGSGPVVSGYFAWPLDGGVVTQGLHGWNAVDIGAPKGTSIYAAAGGTVIVADDGGGWSGGYGNYVVISHPNGTETLYAHMSRVLTSVGTQVAQGDTIGLVGETGLATGPHLHFEVRGAANPFASLPLGSTDD